MQQCNTEQNNAASASLCYLQADLLAPSAPGGRAPRVISTSLQRAQGDPLYPSSLATNEIGITLVHFPCCYKSTQLLVYSEDLAILSSLVSLHCWNTKYIPVLLICPLHGYHCGGRAEMCSRDVSSYTSSIRKTNVLKMHFRKRKSFMTVRHILPRHKN